MITESNIRVNNCQCIKKFTGISESKMDLDEVGNFESLLFPIELKGGCNYENEGQRFSNEINSIGKCVNPDFENVKKIFIHFFP